MAYQSLDFDLQDGIAWITINRPASYNAIDLHAVKELLDVANRISSDDKVRCAVLTGAGDKAFCAGGDVASFVENQDDIGFFPKGDDHLFAYGGLPLCLDEGASDRLGQWCCSRGWLERDGVL